MRTGSTQHSTILRDERGLSKPWKASNWPCGKSADRALFILSRIDCLLVEEESHQIPRHFTDFSIGRHVSQYPILKFVEWMLLFVERRAHFSGANLRIFEDVRLSTMATCSAESSMLAALDLMSSAWANAPRKRLFTLKPRFLCFKVNNRGLMTRLNNKGERTEPWQIPRKILKGFDRWFPDLTWLTRPQYQFLISLQLLPHIPELKSSSSRKLNYTVSKALAKS